MFWFKQKETREKLVVPINGIDTTVYLYHENRSNCRVALGKKGIHIRLSNDLNKDQKILQTTKFLNWAKNQLKQKEIVAHNSQIGYHNNRVIHLYDQSFKLNLIATKTEKGKATLNNKILTITLPEFLSEPEKNLACADFITKIFRKLYQHKIEKKLHDFNDRFQFGVIHQVRLKNNASNWGSCSSKGNINISVRLLLAPEDVVDYVLLHELAHLKEQNHGLKYWKIVASVCPDYRKQELWLKQNGHLCKI